MAGTNCIAAMLTALALLAASRPLVADDPPAAPEPRKPDVVFVPTAIQVVDAMLRLAEVTAGDVVYDLGCGDGRIMVMASKRFGAKSKGFDINPQRIRESRVKIRQAQVEQLATATEADIFTLDLSECDTVVTLYLLPALNVRLIPQLEKLPPGARIVSHDFDMRGIKPEKVIQVDAPDRKHTLYLWRTPLVREADETGK